MNFRQSVFCHECRFTAWIMYSRSGLFSLLFCSDPPQLSTVWNVQMSHSFGMQTGPIESHQQQRYTHTNTHILNRILQFLMNECEECRPVCRRITHGFQRLPRKAKNWRIHRRVGSVKSIDFRDVLATVRILHDRSDSQWLDASAWYCRHVAWQWPPESGNVRHKKSYLPSESHKSDGSRKMEQILSVCVMTWFDFWQGLRTFCSFNTPTKTRRMQKRTLVE